MREEAKHREEKSLARILVQAARAHRNRLNGRLATIGLMAGQEQVLQVLAAGPLSIGDLAAALHVRSPTVSKTISRLSGLGLVQRLPLSAEDSRIVRVALTEAGQDKAGHVDALWHETETQLTAGFDAKEQKQLRKLLRRAIKGLASLEELPETGEPTDKPVGKKQKSGKN